MGGSGLIGTRLGLELANLGHDIHFLFYKRPFFLKDHDNLSNVTFHEVDRLDYALFRDIGSPYTIQAASKIVDIVKTNNIDIINAHYAIPHAIAVYLASQIHPMNTVITTHGSDTHSLGPEPNYNLPVSLSLQNATQVTSVSNFLARETEIVFNLPSNSVKTIYDFIDTQEFLPTSGTKDLTIIQASNFRPVKQLPLLIEIFSHLVEEFPKWQLSLVGNGPDWPKCVRLVRELKIKKCVNFLGVRNDVPQLLSKASILASTSQIESFGITLVEALSCETPVLAPRVGGIPEVCIDGKTGLLYEPSDKDDAIEKMRRLMADEQLRYQLGKNGRKYVQDSFRSDYIIKQYEDLFFYIIENK